jgi:hypothetical protein
VGNHLIVVRVGVLGDVQISLHDPVRVGEIGPLGPDAVWIVGASWWLVVVIVTIRQ